MKRHLPALVLLLSGAALSNPLAAAAAPSPTQSTTAHASPLAASLLTHDNQRVLRACLTDEGESAFPCAWHALSMGNHQGRSFRIFRDGRVKIITHKWAFHLLGDCDSNGPIFCRSV